MYLHPAALDQKKKKSEKLALVVNSLEYLLTVMVQMKALSYVWNSSNFYLNWK